MFRMIFKRTAPSKVKPRNVMDLPSMSSLIIVKIICDGSSFHGCIGLKVLFVLDCGVDIYMAGIPV